MKQYPLFKVHIDIEAAMGEIKKVMESGYINEGVQVTQLENVLKQFLGESIVLTNSGTSALTLALKLAGVQPGDEVITTPMTCVATNTPIVAAGAKVRWADIDPTTGMLTVETVRVAFEKSAGKAKVVMYVAWAGNLSDNLLPIQQFCTDNGISLVLDAAHSFCAAMSVNEKIEHVSDLIDYTCFSLQAIKHFTTGDGGVLGIGRSKTEQYRRARRLRWFGLDRDAAKDDKGDWKGQQWDADIIEAGHKFNMNNVSAAIGLSQVPHITRILNDHARNASLYDQLFLSTDIKPLVRSKDERTSRWVYTIRTPLKGPDKMKLIELLNAEGIKAGLVHIPNDHYACFASSRDDLPGVREFEETQFSLPCGWWLGGSDVEHIAKRVIENYDSVARVRR